LAIVFAGLGLPFACLFDTYGIFFILTSRVGERAVLDAYRWTVVGLVVVIGLALVLGAQKKEKAFLSKSISPRSQRYYNNLWIGVLCASALATFVNFISTGFTIPLLELISDPANFLLQRSEARAAVNQNLLNLNLVFLCPFSICISAFFIKRWRIVKILISILNILVVSSFSLAKSPIAIAFLVVIIFSSCIRPISYKRLMRMGVLLVAIVIPIFMLASAGRSTWGQNKSVVEIVVGRILYGQWTGLPYFFEIYKKKKASIGTLLPPYLRSGDGRWEYKGEESPSRQSMRAVTGYRNLETAGVGVAVTFFIGEAYAVWGVAGAILGSLLVGFEIYLLTWVFSHWPRNIWTMFLYSWFTYKIGIGIMTGFSAFIFSSLAYLLAAFFLLTLMLILDRRTTDPKPALVLDDGHSQRAS